MIPILLALLLDAGSVAGVVYDDANANGRRDTGEAGLAGIVVSDGTALTSTGPDGAYRLEEAAGRYVFVVTPGDRRASGSWFRQRRAEVDFPLARDPAPGEWRFAHLSDSHVHAGNVEAMRRALARAAEEKADFAVVSGDLVRDALRVDDETAREQFALYSAAIAQAPLAVRSAMGNHDVFGIERHLSLVPTTDAAYGKAMYEETLGPRYSAFNRGRIHFLVLDTIGVDDLWYYGFLDAQQLDWIRRELARVPPGTTVVTVGHIPLRAGALSGEYVEEGPARTLLAVDGKTSFRHVVRNARALAEVLEPYRWTLALQGHTHMGERLRLWDGGDTRYHTAPAVDRQPWAPWPSGFFVYTVRGDAIDEGSLVTLEER